MVQTRLARKFFSVLIGLYRIKSSPAYNGNVRQQNEKINSQKRKQIVEEEKEDTRTTQI